jgi:hypothetical protein
VPAWGTAGTAAPPTCEPTRPVPAPPGRSSSRPYWWSDAVRQMLRLSAVFMLVTLVVFAGYGWGAGAVRTHVLTRPRVLA